MYSVYEIFEVLPNGSTLKISRVSGLEFANLALRELAKRTSNECFVADARTRRVVAQLNVSKEKWRAAKRIFQIAYDEQLGLRRAELLRSLGYGVISVIGNDPARVLLTSIQHYDLFIVGHAAPEETRTEMIDWIRVKYPKVNILALNPPHQQLLNADYNVTLNGPENWLPIVTLHS
ncbi:MAG: hypothetical protein DMG48_07325 [Acidobacteria bacterium]|nr:MAG: hypothetical protein DMG48_07325 [Acidobacteriota bacterium]